MLLWGFLYPGFGTSRAAPWCVLLGSGLGLSGEGRQCRVPSDLCLFPSRTVHYNPTSTKHFSFSVGAVPRGLQPQLGVLRYFASYMEQHLMKVCGLGWGTRRTNILVPFSSPLWRGSKLKAEPLRETSLGRALTHVRRVTCLCSQGGDLPSVEEVEVPVPPLLLQWVKTDQALLMLFSDGTVQVRASPGMGGRTVGRKRLGAEALINATLLCTGELLRRPHQAGPQWLGAPACDFRGPQSQRLYLPCFPPPAAGLLPGSAAAAPLYAAAPPGPLLGLGPACRVAPTQPSGLRSVPARLWPCLGGPPCPFGASLGALGLIPQGIRDQLYWGRQAACHSCLLPLLQEKPEP